MEKKLLLFIIGLISIIDANAKKIDGIIVLKNDSISHVTFNIPFYPLFGLWFEGIQGKIKYYNSANELIKLKPCQAKEIRFTYKDEDIRMLSCEDSIFLALIVDGRLKLFYVYDRGNGRDEGNNSHWLLQKGDGGLFYPPQHESDKKFEKEMKDYLSDCPEVIKKTEIPGYGHSVWGTFGGGFGFDIVEIVKEYNNCK